jgi:hypothetical protein
MSAVLEIVQFKLASTATPAALAEAVQSMAPWLKAQPGFERRELVGPDEAGAYTDVVRWRSLAEAHAAAAQIMSSDATRPFVTLIEPSSVAMGHHAVVIDQGAD